MPRILRTSLLFAAIAALASAASAHGGGSGGGGSGFASASNGTHAVDRDHGGARAADRVTHHTKSRRTVDSNGKFATDRDTGTSRASDRHTMRHTRKSKH